MTIYPTKTCSTCKKEKPLDEFHKDKSTSTGVCSRCKACSKVACADWCKANSEQNHSNGVAWVTANPEKVKRNRNAWGRANPEKRNAATAMRLATKLQRTPAWANKGAILEVYKEARALQEATGIPHHVDHRVPLLGKKVSGLHVEYNLQAIPATENLIKHNSFDPDDYDHPV